MLRLPNLAVCIEFFGDGTDLRLQFFGALWERKRIKAP